MTAMRPRFHTFRKASQEVSNGLRSYRTVAINLTSNETLDTHHIHA